MDSRSGIGARIRAGKRAAAVMGAAATVVLSVAGCVSHQPLADAQAPSTLSTDTTSQASAEPNAQASAQPAPPSPLTAQPSSDLAVLPLMPSAPEGTQPAAASTPASGIAITGEPPLSAASDAAVDATSATPAIPAIPAIPATASGVATRSGPAVVAGPTERSGPPSVSDGAASAAAASDASDASDASAAAFGVAASAYPADPSIAIVVRQKKRALLAAYESKLRHDRAVVSAYRFEHGHVPAAERANDRAVFLRRMLQDGLMRLSAPELLEWAQLQRSLADRGAVGNCTGMRSPQDEQGRALSIDALSVDEVAQYLDLSYTAIHDAAIHKPFSTPSKWRVQAAQINLAAQVVGLIAHHPEDAKRLALFEAEGEKKTVANRCWMAALGMRAALRLSDPDRDVILRTLVQRDAR